MDDWRTHQPLPAPIGAIAFYRPSYADKKGAIKRGSGKPPLGSNACIVDALATLAEDEPAVNPYERAAKRDESMRLLLQGTSKWLEGLKDTPERHLTSGHFEPFAYGQLRSAKLLNAGTLGARM